MSYNSFLWGSDWNLGQLSPQLAKLIPRFQSGKLCSFTTHTKTNRVRMNLMQSVQACLNVDLILVLWRVEGLSAYISICSWDKATVGLQKTFNIAHEQYGPLHVDVCFSSWHLWSLWRLKMHEDSSENSPLVPQNNSLWTWVNHDRCLIFGWIMYRKDN